MQERPLSTLPGLPLFAIWIVAVALSLWVLVGARMPLLAIPSLIVLGIALFGFFIVQPNTAAVLQLFGSYVGTSRDPGLRWANPFFSKIRISLRVRNFEGSKLKVNDHDGSPIEIASIVVWQVVDAAQAVFNVDDYESFVRIQSESALRSLTSRYPYDAHDSNEIALRSHSQEVSEQLMVEVQDKLAQAGVNVLDARISHLAYAQEIAHAMLQRQQANAVIAARTRIVEGAVSMVEMALTQLSERGVVQLDQERRAAMVSNLLVVLCADRGTQPIINAGSLY
jgi:regulator of protease activity HflC (stomatin/prohibitin superfamily)